jgi:preprotein translocase subunit SecA
MEWLKTPPDVPIESKTVTRSIRSAQTQVEQQNFEIRKDLLKYDDVMNRQRHVVYDERRKVLEGADLTDQIHTMIDEVIAGYVTGATADGFPEEWDLDQLWRAFRQLYPRGITVDQMIDEAGGERAHLSAEVITEVMQQDALTAYQHREEELTPEMMRELERRVVLSVLDRKWREHLYEMDYLREGITLRGYGQRDPLIEYQREGFDMFSAMMEGIKEESVASLFNLQVQWQENPIVEDGTNGDAPNGASQGAFVIAPGPGAGGALPGAAARGPGATGVAEPARPGRHSRTGTHARPAGQPDSGEPEAPSGPAIPAALAARGLDRPQRRGGLHYTSPSEDASGKAEQRDVAAAASGNTNTDYSKVGRNAPCPCGSGRKFKQCHGDPRNR